MFPRLRASITRAVVSRALGRTAWLVLSCGWIILLSSRLLGAPKYHAVALYLDATQAAKVLLGRRSLCRAMAQEFPISAKPLPVTKGSRQLQISNIIKPRFFNSLQRACGCPGAPCSTLLWPVAW